MAWKIFESKSESSWHERDRPYFTEAEAVRDIALLQRQYPDRAYYCKWVSSLSRQR